MPKAKPKSRAIRRAPKLPPPSDGKLPAPRRPDGTWQAGFSGRQGVDPGRARRDLNADTIREMHAAFRQGGRAAIEKVMTQQPAIFLKLLVLLVPRELEVTTRGGPGAMSTEAIEAAIERITAMLDARTIDVTPGAQGDEAEGASATKD